MELHQLRYFVATAEAGSMSRAAQRCMIAQPSLSQQIQKLEHAVGQRLFDRLGRGVALTEAGRTLLPRARRILAEVREVEQGLRSGEAGGPSRLAVGAIPTMAPYLLPAAIAQLRREDELCELIVREDLTEKLIEAVVDNELDVAVVSTPIDNPLIELEVIGSEELVVVVQGGCELAERDSATATTLRREPTVTLHEMHCLGQQVTGFCATRGINRNVVCRTTQLTTVLELVRLGLGISLVPQMAAEADRADSGRSYLRVAGGAPRREIALAWRVGRTRSRVGVRFGEVVEELL